VFVEEHSFAAVRGGVHELMGLARDSAPLAKPEAARHPQG
jgi:hypothetical protein